MLKMSSTSLLVVSQPVSRTWDSFVNSSVTFNTETTFGLRLSFQKPLCNVHACRDCWQTSPVCAEPHASHWICHCIWQQSVAVFNEIWKQKLMNNF